MVGGLPKELRSKGERGDEEQEGSFRLGSRLEEEEEKKRFLFHPLPRFSTHRWREPSPLPAADV